MGEQFFRIYALWLPDGGRSVKRLHPGRTRSCLLAVEECYRVVGMSPRMGVGQKHGLYPRGSIRPTALELSCMGFKEKPGLKVFTGLDPLCPKCAPYEASQGIYPCLRQEKNWGRAIPIQRGLAGINQREVGFLIPFFGLMRWPLRRRFGSSD